MTALAHPPSRGVAATALGAAITVGLAGVAPASLPPFMLAWGSGVATVAGAIALFAAGFGCGRRRAPAAPAAPPPAAPQPAVAPPPPPPAGPLARHRLFVRRAIVLPDMVWVPPHGNCSHLKNTCGGAASVLKTPCSKCCKAFDEVLVEE